MRTVRFPTPALSARCLWVWTCWLVIGLSQALTPLGVVLAEDDVPSARGTAPTTPKGTAPATTALEAGPVRSADLILVGRVAHIQEIRSPGGGRGRQLIRVEVVEILLGEAPQSKEVSVMVLGLRPTLDPDQPSVPYFNRPGRDLFVLFLGRQKGQFAYRLQTLFEGKGGVGREKIAVSKAIARLSAIADPEEKAKRTLAALIAMSKGAGNWTKAFAARELNYLAGVQPAVFDARSRARLQRMPSLTLSPDQRFWFKRLFQTLAESGSPGAKKAGSKAAAQKDPWRRTFLAAADPDQQKAMLQSLLSGPAAVRERHAAWAWHEMEPSLRIWYARAVGAGGSELDGRRLRRIYGAEEDRDVRAAIIRTVGLTGGDADLEWLVQRASNLRLRRPALLALARVGTPRAVEHLKKAQRGAQEAHETDLAKWIEFLLSPAFAQSERNAGR